MIIDIHEKYDVSPEWFEQQVKEALAVSDVGVIEKLVLPHLCTLLSIYKVKDEAGAKEAAERMKSSIDSPLIDAAMEQLTTGKY
ncbi:MAG: hypothetical protein IKS55_15050 [Oscillospiraceae bacterium]|nr:hypothetical protein [Oscillospiraceae bacterium]